MPRAEKRILETIYAMFPEAGCELDYRTTEELAIAVILSAQTTDVSVNKVTPILFDRFEDLASLAEAKVEDIEACIQSIGLYRNKAKALKAFAGKLVESYNGKVPSDPKDLMDLPGVGRKTANVILAVGFQIPALAVDTHVHRVSLRLGLVPKGSDVVKTELALKKKIPVQEWIQAHHALLFFGRYHCLARNPKCDQCPLRDVCRYDREIQKKSLEKQRNR